MRRLMKLTTFNRWLHHWGSILIALPLAIVLVTGVLLLMKKDWEWVQPATIKGETSGVSLGFDEILDIARAVPEARIEDWSDVDRLDVRPGKGMLKVRAKNRWEIQIDANTGGVLQVAYRRSDFIESIHDGSIFGEFAKYRIFLPSALIVIGLWITGMILFFHPYVAKARNRKRREAALAAAEAQRRAAAGSGGAEGSEAPPGAPEGQATT